jgi:DNA-binding transcriptional LysR family regulator
MRDDLQSLVIFVRAVDAGSFTAAAHALGTTTSSISKRIARLEADVGVRLIERTTRRIAVTEPGRLLYAQAVRAIRALDEARRSVSALGTSPQGLLRVIVDDALADRAIAPLVPALLRAHPELRVELVVGDAATVDLVADGFDVAVTLGGERKDSSQLVRRVGSVDRVICAAPSWLGREPATLEMLTQSRAELSTIAALREAAVAGLGLIRVARIAVADELRDGRLQEVLPEHAQRNVPVQTLQPGGRLRAPKTAAFVTLLARELPARLAAPPSDRRAA